MGVLGNIASGINGFKINIDGPTTNITTDVTREDGSGLGFPHYGLLQLNAWQHLMTVYDGTELKLYLNGVEIGSDSATNVSATVSNALDAAVGDTSAFRGWRFEGKIDEVRIYDRALSTNEVLLLFNGDSHEPDNMPIEAGYLEPGITNSHTFSATNEMDWTRFFAVTNFGPYKISTIHQGTNINSSINLYYQEPSGSLINIATADTNGFGLTADETQVLNDPSNAFYFVEVRPSPGSISENKGWGEESDYELAVNFTGQPPKDIVVVAAAYPDLPGGVDATLDSSQTLSFNGNVIVTFPDVSVGMHTVQVSRVNGVRPREHPTFPSQTDNLDSFEYGNPRRVEISDLPRFPLFNYFPVTQSLGRVRDALTYEYVKDVAIGFATTNYPATDGTIYAFRSGYPFETAHQTQWVTGVDGGFPPFVYLYPVAWDLVLTRDGYATNTEVDKVPAGNVGDTNDLGTLVLSPIDTNTNGIADGWEEEHFGAGANVVPTDDQDSDGLNNLGEYLAGTDPFNPDDNIHLQIDNAEVTLTWTAKPWRTYSVQVNTQFNQSRWQVAGGPFSNNDTIAEMQWTDPQSTANPQRVYRIELITP